MSDDATPVDDSLWGSNEIATIEEIRSAAEALKGYDDILRTPLLPDWPIDGKRLGLKLESLQTTGSFKIRGMRYKLHQVTRHPKLAFH